VGTWPSNVDDNAHTGKRRPRRREVRQRLPTVRDGTHLSEFIEATYTLALMTSVWCLTAITRYGT